VRKMNKTCRKHLGITLSLFLAISVLVPGFLILSVPSLGHAQSLGDLFLKGITKALEEGLKETEESTEEHKRTIKRQQRIAEERNRKKRWRKQQIEKARRRERERQQRIAEEGNRKERWRQQQIEKARRRERERQQRIAEERNRKKRWRKQQIEEARRRERERQQRIAQERYKRTGSLPPCPGSPARDRHVKQNWMNCVGTFSSSGGDKYVGEFRDGVEDGQGTFTYANGRVLEGVWKFGKFHYAKKALSPIRSQKRLAERSRRNKEERLARLEERLKKRRERLALKRKELELKREEARLNRIEKELKQRRPRVTRRTSPAVQDDWRSSGYGF